MTINLKFALALFAATVVVLSFLTTLYWYDFASIKSRVKGVKTVQDRVEEFGPKVRSKWAELIPTYPPPSLTLIALKEERRLEVWVDKPAPLFVTSYPILAASGTTGTKLREGDGQVPEDIYKLEYLNPNSLFHLSMKINYPNEFDREFARAEGRDNLGGDIFIHGRSVSIGCLAIGDDAIEELFVLIAESGHRNVSIIIAPYDMRTRSAPLQVDSWHSKLYDTINSALSHYAS